MLSSILTLALATAAAAKQFTVAFTVADGNVTTYLSANAVQNTTSGSRPNDLVIVGERMSISPGTPAFFTGNNTNANLHFNLTTSTAVTTKGIYGGVVPPVNEQYGYAATVIAALADVSDSGWVLYNDGTIFHKQRVALNQFFACQVLFNGQYATILKWGVPQNNVAGSPPVGCQTTRVFQNNNLS